MKKKIVALIQSNYLPWKGYFDIISLSDLFVFHDDLQYTKQDWRNRNKIKTPNGIRWLTIPCGSKENRKIYDVIIPNPDWQKSHWEIIKYCYHKAPYFNYYKDFFESIYLGVRWNSLSALNQYLIQYISTQFFKMKTKFDDTRNYRLIQHKGARVLELLKKVEATDYISGPSAQKYIKDKQFLNAGIHVHWMDYSGYKKYHQLYPPFTHEVSVIDLLFSEGPNGLAFMKSHNKFK